MKKRMGEGRGKNGDFKRNYFPELFFDCKKEEGASQTIHKEIYLKQHCQNCDNEIKNK